MICCPSCRNNACHILGGFCEYQYDHDDTVRKDTQADPSIFTVILSVIQVAKHRIVEGADNIGEVQAVILYVRVILVIVPFLLHCQMYIHLY